MISKNHLGTFDLQINLGAFDLQINLGAYDLQINLGAYDLQKHLWAFDLQINWGHLISKSNQKNVDLRKYVCNWQLLFQYLPSSKIIYSGKKLHDFSSLSSPENS